MVLSSCAAFIHGTKNENRSLKLTMTFVINYQFHISQHTLSREIQWNTQSVTSCANFAIYYFEPHGFGSRPGYEFFWDPFEGSFHSFDQSKNFNAIFIFTYMSVFCKNLMLSFTSLLGYYVNTSKYKIRLHMLLYSALLCSASFVKNIPK
jgi:hypothetical protein